MIPKRSKHYRARDGQLYRVCTSKNKQEERLCLDVKTRRQVFEGCHVAHSVMELSGMQRKRQETTAELMDKFQCVHNHKHFVY